MKKHLLLFTALCAMTVGCGDSETAKKDLSAGSVPEASADSENGNAVASSSDTDIESNGETESSGEKEAEVAKSPKEMFTALNKEFDKAMREFRTEWSNEKDEKAKRKLVETKLPKPMDYAERFLAIYESDPDSEYGMKALEWVASRDREGESGKKAIGILLNNHPDSEALPGMIYGMQRRLPSEATEKTIRGIIDGDASPELKGVATMALASYLQNTNEMKASLDEYREILDGDSIEYLEKFEVSTEELLALFGTVKSEYADVKISPRYEKTLGEMAVSSIFVLENLAIGCEAPDIEGEDLQGTEFKLSDYRGKVVVLDFWGDW